MRDPGRLWKRRLLGVLVAGFLAAGAYLFHLMGTVDDSDRERFRAEWSTPTEESP